MTHRPSTAPLLGIDLLRALTTTTFLCDNYFFFKTATTTSSNLRQLPLLLRQLPLLLRQLPLLLRQLPLLLRQLPLLLRQLPPTSCDNYLLLIQICDNYLPFPATTTTTILRQLLPATTTTSCDNLQRPIMLFTCVPAIWQHVPESNQNCSDNYKTEQPLTNTISPDPISDPIGAVLDYFGLLYEDAESEQTLNKQIKTPDRTERFPQPKHTSKSAQKQRACNQIHTQQLTQFDLGENRERVCAAASIDNAEPDRKLDQTNQIQRLDKNETETQTTATQDMTTRDLIAPGVRTADEHHTQVGAETVESLQATIGEPRIQYFPSDLYEAQFDPTSIDAERIVKQIRYQESKCSLYDFDAGPPCTIEEH